MFQSKLRRRRQMGAVDPRVKSLNYLKNILAKIDAQSAPSEPARAAVGAALRPPPPKPRRWTTTGSPQYACLRQDSDDSRPRRGPRRYFMPTAPTSDTQVLCRFGPLYGLSAAPRALKKRAERRSAFFVFHGPTRCGMAVCVPFESRGGPKWIPCVESHFQ
jgi:hypothetical protein